MKKTAIFIWAILICLSLLWLWFYFGKFNNLWIEKSEINLFDKQNQCANMYSSIKQYLTDQYEFWNPEDWNNYSRIVSIDVWYSPKYDSCIVWLEYDHMIYKYTIKEHYYEPELNFKLINVTNWYSNIYTCIYRWNMNNDCRDDYYLKKSQYHN